MTKKGLRTFFLCSQVCDLFLRLISLPFFKVFLWLMMDEEVYTTIVKTPASVMSYSFQEDLKIPYFFQIIF